MAPVCEALLVHWMAEPRRVDSLAESVQLMAVGLSEPEVRQ
jgi:hypothetical protein